jgi:chromosome segregation ATPase
VFLLFSAVSEAANQNGVSVLKSKNSAVDTVIKMLGKEKDKVSADLDSENKEMTEYFGYCDDVQKETNYYIKEANRKITDLTGLIEDRTAQISALEEEIADLGSEVADTQEDLDNEKKHRARQHKEFLQREEEQSIMVKELTDMEAALKEQMAAMTTPPPLPAGEEGEAAHAAGLVQEDSDGEDDGDETEVSPSEGNEALVQLHRHTHHHTAAQGRLTPEMLKHANIGKLLQKMSKVVDSLWKDPESQKNFQTVSGFLQQAEDPNTVEVSAEALAGQAENTENNMNAFEGLKKKAEEALQRERDNEVKKQSEHDVLVVSLTAQIKLAEDKIADCKKDKARLSEEKSEAEGEVATTEEAKAQDEKSLKRLTTECDGAASAWDTRQKEAAEEMAAIEKAKEILASRVTVFVQKVVHSSRASQSPSMLRQTLINHFRSMGQKLGSLSMLNLVSVASAQPLDKVKGLISDLIAKLQKEAADAADLHEFCTAEKKKNEEANKKATTERDELQTVMDKAQARKDDLTDNIAQLTSEIAEIDAASVEAEKLRQEQHTNFVKSEADFSEAADAVQDAMDVLKDYYDNALLVQTGAVKGKKAPPKLGGAKQDSAGGILAILDTMAGEFTKTVAELQATEKEQVKGYKEMKQQNFESKNAKELEITKSENEIGSMDITLGHREEDHKLVLKELKAIAGYVEKLKPQCERRPMSYAERKAKRDAEIEGLKDALAAIEENTPGAFVQLRNLRH